MNLIVHSYDYLQAIIATWCWHWTSGTSPNIQEQILSMILTVLLITIGGTPFELDERL